MAGFLSRLFGRGERSSDEAAQAAAQAEPEVERGPEVESEGEPEVETEPEPGSDGEISGARLDLALRRLRDEIPAPDEEQRPQA